MDNTDDTALSDLGTLVPPTYQMILLSASMGSIVVIGFFMWLCFGLHARKIYADSEFSPLSWAPTLVSVILYIFKYMSIVSLSFLANTESTTNSESWFSTEWIQTLVTFGKGILSWLNKNSIYIQFLVGLLAIIVSIILFLPILLCKSCLLGTTFLDVFWHKKRLPFCGSLYF